MKNLSKKQQNEKKKNKKRKHFFRYFFFNFVKWTGALPILLWFRPKYYYENRLAKKRIKGGALVIANHINMIDPVVLHCKLWYRNFHIVAMKELFETKMKKWFFTNVLCLPIDRENMTIRSLKEMIQLLKEQKIVGIFPEGHINNGENNVDAFKSGAVLMATQANVPIVPIALIKREKWYNRQTVVVGEPIQIKDGRLTLQEINQISEQLHKKEIELIKIYEERRKKK